MIKHNLVRTLVVSMHDETHHVEKALAAGADGYVVKDKGVEETCDAVAALIEGRTYLCSEVKDKLRS